MNLQQLLNRKARGQRVADGDHFVQLSVDGALHQGQITDVEAMATIAADGRETHEIKVLVSYAVPGGEQYAQVTQTCVAPIGCELDWGQVLCAWDIERLSATANA